jgi:Spy/CpxP family protein refolding chaperone
MKFSTKILSVLFAFLMLSLASLASAEMPDKHPGNQEMGSGMENYGGPHGGYGGGEMHNTWMRPHNAAVHFLQMKDVLGLSEKQINDLKALRDAYRTENTVNEAKLKTAEQELREILEEDTVNVEKAEAKLKEIGPLESSLWLSFVKHLAKVKILIPKDQIQKLHEMRKNHPMMEMK